MTDFDHPPAGATSLGASRLIGLDVTRAVALIGVVVMNYHGSLNNQDLGRDFWHRVFHVYTGPLSTRFAATFVLVAGAGTALLARRGFANRGEARILRLRLARRGTLLLFGGYFLDQAWPGTILFFYGAYFLLSAGFIFWRTRYLAVLAIITALSAASLSAWEESRQRNLHSTQWLHPDKIDSLNDLLLRVFVDYTHPVLPWLSFFLVGVILGRNLDLVRRSARLFIGVALTIVAICYGVATLLNVFEWRGNPITHVFSSMEPFNRGLLYTTTTAAVAVIAFVVISNVAENHRQNRIIVLLQRSGQTTLSIYLLHVLVFYIFVDWTQWVSSSGLDTALIFAVIFWLFGITIASWWQHHFGVGPVERLYRIIGG